MPTSALSPVRAGTEVVKLIAVFDVGSNGDMTIKYGKGIASVADTATGKYTVTFTDPHPILLDMAVRIQSIADEEPLVCKYVVDSFDLAAKTATFEVNEIDETEALAEPVSGSDCYIEATFLKTA